MKKAQGYTLVETVVSLGLFGMLFALALPFLHHQRRIADEQATFREELLTLRAAMGWLVRDLQEAGFHSDGPPIAGMEKGGISYLLSRDGGDSSDFAPGNRRLISVYLKGESLMYRIRAWDQDATAWRRGSTHTLASGLSSLRFRGLDATGNPASAPGAVVSVEISLRGRRAGTFRSLVALRNIRGGGP